MPKNSSLKSQTERYEQHDERVKQRPHTGFPLVSALCVDDRSVCTNVLLKASWKYRSSREQLESHCVLFNDFEIYCRGSRFSWNFLKVFLDEIKNTIIKYNSIPSPNPLCRIHHILGMCHRKIVQSRGKKLSVTKCTCDRAFGSGGKFSDRLFWKIATVEKQDHGNPSPIYFLATY